MYNLKVVVPNAATLARESNDAFREIRRMGFGASDASIILGVNPFPDSNIDDLKKQKISKEPTTNELKIGKLSSVRKGAALEPIILAEFEKEYGIEVNKPEPMYNIEGTYLNVNYDGIYERNDEQQIPIEIKLMTRYGKKYYDLVKAISGIDLLSKLYEVDEYVSGPMNLHIMAHAKKAGIPIYYYTQLQQQMMGLNAPYGYLVVMDDDRWELKVFTVMQDKPTQDELIRLSNIYGDEIFKKD